jgi:hypothetical protein
LLVAAVAAVAKAIQLARLVQAAAVLEVQLAELFITELLILAAAAVLVELPCKMILALAVLVAQV